MYYKLTSEGIKKAEQYIAELKAKRKEILDASKDTIDETQHVVDIKGIEDDINFGGVDEDGEYLNNWYVTDHYDTDYPICLKLGIDFIEVNDD